MKSAAQLAPEASLRISNPKPPRPDALISSLCKQFKFELWDVEGWKGRPVLPQLNAMLQAVHHFQMDIVEKKTPRWLSLLGTTGAGKTYLAREFWRWYKKSQLYRPTVVGGEIYYPGAWCNWPGLAGDLQGNSGYDELYELGEEQLLIIDEIGADRDKNGHVRDCLVRLLSHRVGKWTMITSNKYLNQIETEIDSRISSRMLRDGSVTVEVTLPDYAMRKQ